jgi:hypothetical protein
VRPIAHASRKTKPAPVTGVIVRLTGPLLGAVTRISSVALTWLNGGALMPLEVQLLAAITSKSTVTVALINAFELRSEFAPSSLGCG